MKNFSALLAAGLFALPAFAQQTYTVSPAQTITVTRPVAGEELASPQAALDTLTQYLDRATDGQVTVYSYSDGTNNWPVTGTNTLYLFLGTKYTVSQQASVKGLLVAYAGKLIQGIPDTLTAAIFAINPENGLPSEEITNVRFTTDIIDTSSSSLALTYIDFPEDGMVSSSFAAMVQTVGLSLSAPPDPNDLFAIFSNQQGDGQNENNGIFLTVQNSQLVAGFLSQLPLQIQSQPLNFDPIIIPVVETTTTDVQEAAALNGLSLKGAYPSPASDNSAIHFAMEQPSFVEIGLLDMTGKTMFTVRRDYLPAGEHAIDLNVAELPAGSYLYTVRTGFSALAGKITVVK